MTKRASNAYLGNPWLLSFTDFRLLVLLPDHSRPEIAKKLNMSARAINTQVSRILPYFGTHDSLHACVYFDRWWQKWQREHAEEAQSARACLGL